MPIPFMLWYIYAHKLIATHCCPAFCPNTTTSPWLYGACIVLLWSTWCITGPGFFSISLRSFYFVQLPQSVNYTHVITIWETRWKEPQLFEILLSMCISTCIISHWRVNNSCSAKNCFPSHFLCKPATCFVCTFLSC